VSRALFVAGLDVAANRDLLAPGRDAVREGRQAWLDEVEDVLTRLRLIEDLNATVLEEILGGVGD
jgi:hypothetical protein